jgi:hypothetical protein
MMSFLPRFAAAALAVALLAGCSSGSDPDIEPADPAISAAPDAAPPEPLPAGPLTATQIAKALRERTFGFSAPGRSGTVTYYGDGTFSYEESGKGSGTGLWQSSDGKLCEAYDPAPPFLPRGTPSKCADFASDGSVFRAGSMTLTPS